MVESLGFHFDFARLVWDSDWVDAHRLSKLAVRDEARRFADLLRDVAGNPFRLINFAPAWRTVNATLLAQSMYDSRDFSAMPILADALQDAGCDDADVMNHCRDPHATHVRGCWVVDLILGKA